MIQNTEGVQQSEWKAWSAIHDQLCDLTDVSLVRVEKMKELSPSGQEVFKVILSGESTNRGHSEYYLYLAGTKDSLIDKSVRKMPNMSKVSNLMEGHFIKQKIKKHIRESVGKGNTATGIDFANAVSGNALKERMDPTPKQFKDQKEYLAAIKKFSGCYRETPEQKIKGICSSISQDEETAAPGQTQLEKDLTRQCAIVVGGVTIRTAEEQKAYADIDTEWVEALMAMGISIIQAHMMLMFAAQASFGHVSVFMISNFSYTDGTMCAQRQTSPIHVEVAKVGEGEISMRVWTSQFFGTAETDENDKEVNRQGRRFKYGVDFTFDCKASRDWDPQRFNGLASITEWVKGRDFVIPESLYEEVAELHH